MAAALLPLLLFGTEVQAQSGATPAQTCNDTWTATPSTNAPLPRTAHTAVWTGSEMIVWGGITKTDIYNSGGRYNPGTNTWTATSVLHAPAQRDGHTAIWTGHEMIVWGGTQGSQSYLDSGGKYNPSTNTWVNTNTTLAPQGRLAHTAVWTGSEMIVWGGIADVDLNTGGRYNPSTDTWTAMSVTNAPSARSYHSAVWTGTEMIVWGGFHGNTVSGAGGRYNPYTDTWTPTSTTTSPMPRADHVAVWTGSEMIVWGGFSFANGGTLLNTGGRYRPSSNSWTPTSMGNVPPGGAFPTVIWTGNEMIVWGGEIESDVLDSGGRYNPSADNWTATTTIDGPSARYGHTAVWTGSQMIIWGGFDFQEVRNTGSRYCAQPPSPTPPPVILGNISTRLRVDAGDNALIGGFIVTGTQAKKIIARAIGPSLPVPGALPNPILELRDSAGALLQSNDNWRSDQETEIIATGVPPGNDLESAIVATLPASNSAYTVVVRGVNDGTGVGLVEVYDLDRAADSKLANISTRGRVEPGDNAMIAGTIVLGQAGQRALVRAIGPSLPVPGALSDPTLELRDGHGTLLRANNDWRSDQEEEIFATGIPPSNDLESAIVVSLPSDAAYTAIVRGVNGTSGVALVEVYGLLP